MKWWDRAKANSQRVKLITQMPSEAVVASPRALSTTELLRWAREWAPRCSVTPDGRLMLTEAIEVVGPLDVDDVVRKQQGVPSGMVAVYIVREVGEGDTVDAEDFAHGLAHRVDGWVREAFAKKGWERGFGGAACLRIYAPKRLTAADVAALLAPRLPGLVAEPPEDGELFRLTADRIQVVANRVHRDDTTFPSVPVQHWFTSWTETTEYVIDSPDAGADIQPAGEALRDATGGLLLDRMGFPVY